MSKKRVFGTKEWAAHSYNIATGCKHGCKYCFAHYNDVKKFKTCTEEAWKTSVVDKDKVNKKWNKVNGTIMFPTAHDLVPEIIDDCIIALRNMLSAGNNVLIVSKPHLECIEKICAELSEYKEQILFRFTIGALEISNDKILGYWEPGAPNARERLESLVYAFHKGFKTSVSMEPVLDWDNVIQNFNVMAPYVTDAIWIGVMNFIDERVEVKTDEDRQMVAKMKLDQNMANYMRVYHELKDHKLIKWKESMKSALGLELATEIGLDK